MRCMKPYLCPKCGKLLTPIFPIHDCINTTKNRLKKEKMKTIIAGSRTANRYEDLLHAISQCGWNITKVISGGAIGADTMGELWADEHKIPLQVFEPDWNKYGKSAGIVRNCEMAKNADALIAIWDGKSKGTKHMISEAEKLGLKVYVYYPTPKTDFN